MDQVEHAPGIGQHNVTQMRTKIDSEVRTTKVNDNGVKNKYMPFIVASFH